MTRRSLVSDTDAPARPTPQNRREAWKLLSGFGDDSSLYPWRVRASRDVMQSWRDDPDALDEIEILLRGVRAVHRFQDFVRAGLQRQMNVLGKFRESRDCVDQVVAETDRMRGRETKSFKAFDLVHRFEQLHKRRFVVDLRKFMATVKIHDLPQ